MPARITLTADTAPASIASGWCGTGRAVKATRVTLGPLESTARTTADAAAVIDGNLRGFLAAAAEQHGPIVTTRHGHVTFSTLILAADGPVCHTVTVLPDGRTSGTSTSTWCDPREQAARDRYNLAQRTTVWTDGAAVLDAAAWVGGQRGQELLDYAGFQRAWLDAEGTYSGEDRRVWADLHRAEFIPVPAAA